MAKNVVLFSPIGNGGETNVDVFFFMSIDYSHTKLGLKCDSEGPNSRVAWGGPKYFTGHSTQLRACIHSSLSLSQISTFSSLSMVCPMSSMMICFMNGVLSFYLLQVFLLSFYCCYSLFSSNVRSIFASSFRLFFHIVFRSFVLRCSYSFLTFFVQRIFCVLLQNHLSNVSISLFLFALTIVHVTTA